MVDTKNSTGWLKRIALWSVIFGIGALVGIGNAWLGGKLLRKYHPPVTDHGSVTLTISATIDGADRLVFTHDSVTNKHLSWSPPRNVFFNEQPWVDLSQTPPSWLEMSSNLDLGKATIVNRQSRDVITLEHTAEGFDVYFADTPMGAGKYDVIIRIPRK